MLPAFDSQRLLRQLINDQPRVFLIKDLEHRFVLVCQEFANLLGTTVNEVVGRNELEVGLSDSLVLGNSKSEGLWALEDQVIAAAPTHCSPEDNIAESLSVLDAMGNLRSPLYDTQGRLCGLLVQSVSVEGLLLTKPSADATCLMALERRNAHLSALEDVVSTLTDHHSLSELFTAVGQIILNNTQANNVHVWLLGESREYMTVVESLGPDRDQFLGRRRCKGEGVAGGVWEAASTLFLDANSTNLDKRAEHSDEKQLCVVPLIGGGNVHGLLMVTANSDEEDIKPEVILIERIASIVSFVVKNKQLMAETRAELVRTHALKELSGWLSSISNPAAGTDVVCRTLLHAIDIARASFFQVDAQGVLQHLVSWGKTERGIEKVPPLKHGLVAETIGQWCFDNEQPAFISRFQDDERESVQVRALRREKNIGSTACMPISYSGSTKGALVVSQTLNHGDLGENDINIFHSIVRQLSAAMERLELSMALQHQADHDSLTLLPNRSRFEHDLGLYCQEAKLQGASGAVLFMNLDGFKLINDSFGHAVGDELLKQVAKKLTAQLRDGDLLARVGGDEFAVITRNLHQPSDALVIAGRLADSLSGSFPIEGENLRVGVSIGISRFPEDGDDIHELQRKADIAVHHAKSSGKGQILYFDQAVSTSVSERTQLEFELKEAIVKKQFQLVYQPQVSCSTGLVDNVEALIRWSHPLRGTISPFDFIPVAEEAGLIHDIGDWVLEEAVSQLAKWRDTSLAGVRVAVNIAASQFQLENFGDLVLSTLARYDVAAELLELEVTESVVMKDMEAVVERLKILRKAGVRIAIDDFGTGYSSLSYLQDLPLDVLKIDRSFILRLQHEKAEQSLVNTILLLASGLGLETVAEGVETFEQQAKVESMGCDYIQGYFYSMPVSSAQLPGVVREINGDRSAVA